MNLTTILKNTEIEASAPCRMDMGGTLDIRTFHYPLRHQAPCTFNAALSMRTHVRLSAHAKGRVRISSRGFESADFPADRLPFAHPLGLMFATAAYFKADGVHIHIDSASPPRSALGGSSAAAVALIAAFAKAFGLAGGEPLSPKQVAVLAHAIEESVAGVPCGLQDQLAAVYGGIHAWWWQARPEGPFFKKQMVLPKGRHGEFHDHMLLAYWGVPHESKNINGRWVRQFLEGRFREEWSRMIVLTKKFIDSLIQGHYKGAAALMREETAIRRQLTPDVLDDLGETLVAAAEDAGCGARFTGAGGGGCLWALGDRGAIQRLEPIWQKVLSERPDAALLDNRIDAQGLTVATVK